MLILSIYLLWLQELAERPVNSSVLERANIEKRDAGLAELKRPKARTFLKEHNFRERNLFPSDRELAAFLRPFRARRVLGMVTQGGVAALLALGYIPSPRWGRQSGRAVSTLFRFLVQRRDAAATLVTLARLVTLAHHTHAASTSFLKGGGQKEEVRKGRGKNEEL